jgi:hypothetical protein
MAVNDGRKAKRAHHWPSEAGTAHRSRACPTSALKNVSKSATADFDGRTFAHPAFVIPVDRNPL